MKLLLNLLTFQKEFIHPLTEINSGGRVSIQVKDNYIYCLTKGVKDAMLYAKYTPVSITDPIDRFNLNLQKLTKGISCIKSDNFSEFSIVNNYLEYQDAKIKFNVKLLDLNMIADVPKITPDNVDKHPIDGTITISPDQLKEITQANKFAIDSNKIYISHDGSDAHLEFGDREVDHRDNIRITLEGACTGEFTPRIYESSFLDLISRNKNDILFKIGQRALIVEIQQDNSVLTYLTTNIRK